MVVQEKNAQKLFHPHIVVVDHLLGVLPKFWLIRLW